MFSSKKFSNKLARVIHGMVSTPKQKKTHQSKSAIHSDGRAGVACPQCGSRKTTLSRQTEIDSLVADILSLKTYRCLSCYNKFSKTQIFRIAALGLLFIVLLILALYLVASFFGSDGVENQTSNVAVNQAPTPADVKQVQIAKQVQTLNIQKPESPPLDVKSQMSDTATRSEHQEASLGLTPEEIVSLVDSVNNSYLSAGNKVSTELLEISESSLPTEDSNDSNTVKVTEDKGVALNEIRTQAENYKKPAPTKLASTKLAPKKSKPTWTLVDTKKQTPTKSISSENSPKVQPSLANKKALNGAQFEQKIRNRIEQWRVAWSTGDIKTYLSMYSLDFIPEKGITLGKWRQQRIIRVTPTKQITLELSDIRVELSSDQQFANVSFFQKYQSKTYRSNARKRLIWIVKDGQWFISLEKSD